MTAARLRAALPRGGTFSMPRSGTFSMPIDNSERWALLITGCLYRRLTSSSTLARESHGSAASSAISAIRSNSSA